MMHEGHDHEHDHGHCHTHTHGDHTHTHEHSHADMENASEPVKKAVIMLDYMYSHNTDHTEELAGMAAKMRELGQVEAAELMEQAVAAYNEGNAKIHDALHKIEG